MNIPSVSLILTRQYVTELVRSRRARELLGPVNRQPPRSAAARMSRIPTPITIVAITLKPLSQKA